MIPESSKVYSWKYAGPFGEVLPAAITQMGAMVYLASLGRFLSVDPVDHYCDSNGHTWFATLDVLMPSLTIKVRTPISAEQFLAALLHFGPERGTIWGNSQPTHLIVHELGETTADVTEGSKILGGTWERLTYDWSQPGVIELRTTDSNIWAAGSGWRYTFTDADDGSGMLITAKVTRYPSSKKGYAILAVFGSVGKPLIKRSFRQSVRAIEKRARI